MASADFERVIKRVVEALNAGDAGSFDGVLSERNKTRNLDAIKAAAMEAGLEIVRHLASFPNEFRARFFSETDIAHGATIPDHSGKVVAVKIRRSAGGVFQEGRQRHREKIEAYRNDAFNLYSEFAHDEEGSPLAGFYDIWNDEFYFTGEAAQITVARATRADVYDETATPPSKIPDLFESIWFKLALSLTLKSGEGSATIGIADRYYNQAMADLAEFKNGKRVFAEVDEPAPVSEVHAN